jgi:hypothetical protein
MFLFEEEEGGSPDLTDGGEKIRFWHSEMWMMMHQKAWQFAAVTDTIELPANCFYLWRSTPRQQRKPFSHTPS